VTPEELVARAAKAKRIIEDPLVTEALSKMEAEIIEAFAACPIRDDEGRRVIQMELQRVRKFKGFFLGVMESGVVAVHDIREKQSMKDRVVNSVRSITA
jgi:hypothetical protein